MEENALWINITLVQSDIHFASAEL